MCVCIYGFKPSSKLFLLSILATNFCFSLSLSQSSHSSGTVTQEKLKTDRTNFLLIGAQEIAPHFNLLPHSQIDM